MKAVHLALSHFRTTLHLKSLVLATDNTTVVACLKNQGGTHCFNLYSLSREILLCWEPQIQLVVRHIPGHLNVLADTLSRSLTPVNTEWELLQVIFNAISLLWGSSSSGSVCYVSEPQAGHFRFSSSRSSSIRCRRNVNLLERNVRLRVPSLQISFPSPSKGGSGIFQDHSYCTGLAKTSLVHRSAASLVCKITSSTEIVYDAKWSIFVNWCVGREIDPIKVSVQQLANFFVHLFEDKGLLPSTIKGYRSSITRTNYFWWN